MRMAQYGTDEAFQDFVKGFDPELIASEPVIEKIENKPKPLKGDEAKYAVMAAFSKDKRINRKVQVQ